MGFYRMSDLNGDIILVWERDYSHLVVETESILGKRDCFRYKGYDFYLTTQCLFIVAHPYQRGCWVEITFDELKSKYFLDILNPSENELIMFELEYGFEFPFCEKNKKINQKEQINEVTI